MQHEEHLAAPFSGRRPESIRHVEENLPEQKADEEDVRNPAAAASIAAAQLLTERAESGRSLQTALWPALCEAFVLRALQKQALEDFTFPDQV